MKVLVRWKGYGSHVEHGVCYQRQPGDEDLMSNIIAKRASVCGLVDILGDPKQRILEGGGPDDY
jgi:hypothetical protein